jgi:predicted dehydrogenase
MQGGLLVQYSGSYVGSRYEFDLLICGENGDLRTNRSKVWWREKGQKAFGELPLVELPAGEEERYPAAGMQSLLNQFRDAIEQGVEPETRGSDNLWTLAMFEAAVQSIATGKNVLIDETFTPELQASAGVAERDA